MMTTNPLLGTYRRVFNTDEGRVVLADLMDFIGIWSNPFYISVRKSERILGQRDLLMYILERLGVSDDPIAIARAIMDIPVPGPEDRQEEAET